MDYIIRPILEKDNAAVAATIRAVLIEHGVPKVGTAYADPQLDTLYDYYQQPRAQYWVVEMDGKIVGSAGVAALENYDGNTCELQKMYFIAIARGKGIGKAMMETCLNFGKAMRFDSVYLETMTYMHAAQKLYKRSGFDFIDGPMGNTGHYSCPVHMLLPLK